MNVCTFQTFIKSMHCVIVHVLGWYNGSSRCHFESENKVDNGFIFIIRIQCLLGLRIPSNNVIKSRFRVQNDFESMLLGIVDRVKIIDKQQKVKYK